MNLRHIGARVSGANPPPVIYWQKEGYARANDVMDILFDLFPDKFPLLLNETTETWEFGLSWPRHLLEPIDTALPNQLMRRYSLKLEQLADYSEVRRYGRVDFVFSMFHSHALLAPTIAAARRGGRPLRWIVHVDSHHDLGAILLKPQGNGRLDNPAFHVVCDLSDSESVVRSIDSGFIHKGNFLSAFCLGNPAGQLFHICSGIPDGRFWLHREVGFVEIGRVTSPKTEISIRPGKRQDEWELSESAVLPRVLPPGVSDGIWLDVDLDAFCNRFDGDSNRNNNQGSAKERQKLEKDLSQFLSGLSEVSWLRHVEAVSVAASPGFFPSEYWDLAIPKVFSSLENLLLS